MSRSNIGRNLPHEELVALLRRRVDGLSIRQTAAACNLDKATVHKYAPDWLVSAVRELTSPEKSLEAG